MGIQIEFNPDLALRENKTPERAEEECLPEKLNVGEVYDFLKQGQRNYFFDGEIPLLITKGNQELSRPIASITILEATHFKRKDGKIWTKRKYQIKEIYDINNKEIHFEGMNKVKEEKIVKEFLSTVYVVHEGKVLLTWNKKVGKWIPLGRHIEPNELPCDSAIREAKEESGFDIELIDLRDLKIKNLTQNLDIQLDIIKPNHHHINISYIGRIIVGKMMEMSDEGTGLKWFSPSEIIESKEIFENSKEKALKAIEIVEGI